MANKFPRGLGPVIEQKQYQALYLNVLVLLILLFSGCGLQGAASVPASTDDQDNVDQPDNSNIPKVNETIINGKA